MRGALQMEFIYNHPVFFGTVYIYLLLLIIQWYITDAIEDTYRELDKAREHCRKLYNARK